MHEKLDGKIWTPYVCNFGKFVLLLNDFISYKRKFMDKIL